MPCGRSGVRRHLAAPFTFLTSPHPSTRTACPPSRFRDVQLSFRKKTVLFSVRRRPCLLRQCDCGFDKHSHPYCHDFLVGIQLLLSIHESSYDGCVRAIL